MSSNNYVNKFYRLQKLNEEIFYVLFHLNNLQTVLLQKGENKKNPQTDVLFNKLLKL